MLCDVGQTGSGKSHSIIGYGADKGLIPRVCEEMFVRINEMIAKDSRVSFAVEVSFMEIYNEQINDLLNASSNRKVRYLLLMVRMHFLNQSQKKRED